MKKCYIYYVLCYLLLNSLSSLRAQGTDWNWPEDRKMAKERYVLYTDALDAGNYLESKENLEWLLENTPTLSKAIYQHAEIIYKKLYKLASDPIQKAEYRDKTIEILDLREKYFGDPDVVANRKALLAYNFYKDDVEQLPMAIKMITHAIDLNQERVFSANLIGWLDLIRRYKQTGADVPKKEVTDAYELVVTLLDRQKIEAKGDPKKLKLLGIYEKKADRILTNSIKIDCDYIKNVFGKRMQESSAAAKNDTSSLETALRHATLFLKLSKTYKCKNPDLEQQAIEVHYLSQPSAQVALLLARRYFKQQNQQASIAYYQQAVDISETAQERAEIYLEIAKGYAEKMPGTSRKYARMALQEVPDFKKAYELIGVLYMSSYQKCKQGISQVEDRAIFIAAHNAFKKANNPTLMQEAMVQFPTVEQIFERGLEEGKKLLVGCWINETVTLKASQQP